MNTTQTRRRKSASYYANHIAGSSDTAAHYAQLAELAEKFHGNGPSPMYDEAQRLRRIAAEYDQDVDDLIEAAAADGYTPEDIEGAL